MLSEVRSLYQVPVDLVSERFSSPASIHAEFGAGVNKALTRMNTGGEMESDLEHLSHLLM